jgi:hypothetical protein
MNNFVIAPAAVPTVSSVSQPASDLSQLVQSGLLSGFALIVGASTCAPVVGKELQQALGEKVHI